MRILLVDDEWLSLQDLSSTVREVVPDAQIAEARSGREALEQVGSAPTDVAFLDIEMPDMNGLTLAKRLKELDPQVNIVFVTAYSQYALEAFRLYASGYLMKPARKEDVLRELSNLRFPLKLDDSKLYIRCFGNFEVFSHGAAVPFRRSKAKEMLAYLVDLRGASASGNELCGVLWEDETKIQNEKAYLRQLLSSLRKTLQDCGAGDVLVEKRNAFSISVERVECDYYRYLQGDTAMVNQYRGEYMKQYSWAEMTIAALEQERQSRE